jgi:hypothetical protein
MWDDGEGCKTIWELDGNLVIKKDMEMYIVTK